MTDLDGVDPWDLRRARSATGLLATFNDAGVIDAADVHVAQRLTTLGEEGDERVALAIALACRAVRGGSVCVDLSTVATEVEGELPWPEPTEWLAAVSASRLATEPTVLRLLGSLLYLDRYWREEEQVCADLLARPAAADQSPERAAALAAGLERIFPDQTYAEQRAAAELALTQRTTVLTGGPGTGKTTTVAALLVLATQLAEAAGEPRPRIALAAPTGKAAARLQASVVAGLARLRLGGDPASDHGLGDLRATTLHRLLKRDWRNHNRYLHNRDNRLPHDLIVIDETSMVSLTMMARLLEAVRPDARLILVGDPGQLASVEAGAVLADLVTGLSATGDESVRIAELTTSHRFGDAIGALAGAVRADRAEDAVEILRSGAAEIEFIEADQPADLLAPMLVEHALAIRMSALAGDAEAAVAAEAEQRLLCAHREGPYGVNHWNRQVERWLSERTGDSFWATWYPGRPFLVTSNDYGLGIFNGDTGVAIRAEPGLRAAVASSAHPEPLLLTPSRLSEVETMHAMTIHKSQGSQAKRVIVLLPPPESKLLTRELFYTAITRAERQVVVVGKADDVIAAVRRPAQRATGLALRLAAERPSE